MKKKLLCNFYFQQTAFLFLSFFFSFLFLSFFLSFFVCLSVSVSFSLSFFYFVPFLLLFSFLFLTFFVLILLYLSGTCILLCRPFIPFLDVSELFLNFFSGGGGVHVHPHPPPPPPPPSPAYAPDYVYQNNFVAYSQTRSSVLPKNQVLVLLFKI